MDIHLNFYSILGIYFLKIINFNMKNSEKLIKLLSRFVENGIISSQDLKREFDSQMKFNKDKLIDKFQLVSREEFNVLKQMVQKQDKMIKQILKKKSKKAKKL
jgi:BMFP domain-containing protein YqiC